MDSQPYTNGSNNYSFNYWRAIVLEQMCESQTVSKGGLHECIENARGFRPDSGCTTADKESAHFGEERHKCTSKTQCMLNGTQNATKGHVGLLPKGSVTQSNYRNNTELCKRAFIDILMSENFAELCHLLVLNFQGLLVDSVVDVGFIDSRMKEGAYEGSPLLFLSDIQQVWTRLEKLGTDLVAHAKSLSDKSRTYSEQQFPTRESTKHAKPDFFTGVATHENCVVFERHNPPSSEIPVVDGIRTNQEPHRELVSNGSEETGLPQVGGIIFPRCNICRHKVQNHEGSTICGNFTCPSKYYHTSCLTSKQLESYGPCWYCPSCLCQACLSDRDDDEIILCDGCDNAYHIYCTRPPLDSIPKGKWFCMKCHEGIHHIRKAVDGIQTNEEPLRELVTSNGTEETGLLQVGRMIFPHCNICRHEVQNHERSTICSTFSCPRKYYHTRCLTSKQLESYGPRWFCPSCLCQACLSDRDDDKIILCDGCDNAYHIYCMRPPLASIPEGNWFCMKCHEGIHHIRKAVDGIRTNEEPLRELVTSNGSEETGLPQVGGTIFSHCNICWHEVRNNEGLTICGNFSCPSKYYHTSCLSSEQLESYGACWYCPSCLCQACLFDRDDDQIILCDGCDNAYHIYCTRPPLASIPKGRWFCMKCKEGFHHRRKERRAYLRKQKKLTKRTEEQKEAYESLVGIQTNEEPLGEVEESLNLPEENGFQPLVVEEINLRCCYICQQEVENCEELKICCHFHCHHKYYHTRCLTSTQLESYGPCWYCPSCLCRACLSDRDDDKVILCDGCDHGYHIYCTQPPLASIPKGRWSCPKCVEASQCIRKPRRTFRRKQSVKERAGVEKEAYESLQILKKETRDEVMDDCGGVDLLLAAAKTVNLEESLAALAMNT